MEELDQLIEEQTPEVAKAINNLIERAGTSDADWNVLLEAGNMIAELRNPLDDAIIKEIYGAFALLGVKQELLYVIASWKDGTTADDLILDRLKTHNTDLEATLQWQIDSYKRVQ